MQKHALLEILSGTVCPVCGDQKHPHVWTCWRCSAPHQRTPELRALSNSCDVHMEAAEVFLAMAKAAYQKPESD